MASRQMRLMQKNCLLVSFVSLIESTVAYIHTNNNVNIGVTINKNIYYIHSAPIGEMATRDNWENVLPKQEIVVPSRKPKPNTPSKQNRPETGGGRISEVEESSSTCKCGRTDVQEPLHFDYTSRLEFTQLAHLTKSFRFSQQLAAKSLGLDLTGKKMARPAVGAGHVEGGDYQVSALQAAKILNSCGTATSAWWAASWSVGDHGVLFLGSSEDQNSARRMLAEAP